MTKSELTKSNTELTKFEFVYMYMVVIITYTFLTCLECVSLKHNIPLDMLINTVSSATRILML